MPAMALAAVAAFNANAWLPHRRDPYNMTEGGINTSRAIAMTLAALAGIALYNVLELGATTFFFFFTRRRGLYFGSLVTSTLAVVPYTLGLMFKFLEVWPPGRGGNWVNVVAIVAGWWAMVTGQSVVLYSRLHLVVRDRRKRRAVLWMMVVSFLVGGVPTAVLVIGTNGPDPRPFATPYAVWERLQLLLYFVQETAISALYVWEISRMLWPAGGTASSSAGGPHLRSAASRRIMRHLLYVNVFIVFLDLTLVAHEGQRRSQAEFSAQSEMLGLVSPLGTVVGGGGASATAAAGVDLDGRRKVSGAMSEKRGSCVSGQMGKRFSCTSEFMSPVGAPARLKRPEARRSITFSGISRSDEFV